MCSVALSLLPRNDRDDEFDDVRETISLKNLLRKREFTRGVWERKLQHKNNNGETSARHESRRGNVYF